MSDFTLEYWQEKSSRISLPNKAFINGDWRSAESGKEFDCINPATNKTLTKVSACDKEDVDIAVKSARASFEKGSWSQASPSERKNVLNRLAMLIDERKEEFALLDSMDMGKPVMVALNQDAAGSAEELSWFAEYADKLYDELAPAEKGSVALITQEAVGVIGAVVPWNFPLMMAIWKLGPSLAAGNSVVLKPAEQSPLSALLLGQLAIEAGLPEGVLNVVPGFGETAGRAIGLHNDVDCVAFTGSSEVGKFFLNYSSQSNMKQIWLECGGKSPNLVFADCDVESAAKQAAFGAFFNQGEVCSCNSRLIIEESIKDEFLSILKKEADSYFPSDPLHPQAANGSMVDKVQTKRVMGYIETGKNEGAELILGGKQNRFNGSDLFIVPTIFDGVKNDMRIAQEEIFGPVLSVITIKDEDEAVRVANDTIYGLAASIFTNNLKRAHSLARRIRAGNVSVNCIDAINVSTPFGGFKQSGFGRDLSKHAFDKYRQLKTTWINIE